MNLAKLNPKKNPCPPPPADWLPGKGADEANRFEFYDGVEFEAFRSLIRKAKQDGLEVVLLQPSVPDAWQEGYVLAAGGEYEAWRNTVEDITQSEIQKIDFIGDHCAEFSSCYNDETHLNRLGATRYSQALAKWLSENYPEIVAP